MNMDDYQIGVLRTTKGDLSLEMARLNAALGLGESGEVQNVVKKEVFHGHAPDRDKIKDELGDQLFYIGWMAHLYDLSLSEVAQFNLDKLRKRYPQGFDNERSINRSE